MRDLNGNERLREGAAVLPFERTIAAGDHDHGLRGGGWGSDEDELAFDDGFGDGFGPGGPGSGGSGGDLGRGYGRDLGHLTMVVMMGDTVVDTLRRPVEGSGYECAALELGRGTVRPEPAPRVVEVPMQPRHELERTWLRSLVGGAEQLDTLTKEPLPDEHLDVDLVPRDLRERVTAIAARVDAVATPLLGVEGRTACRRLLVRAVAAEPALLRSSDRDDIAAGAVIHAIAKGNDVLGPGCALTSTGLWTQMGLKSSPHDRARRFAHAVAGPEGVDGGYSFRRHEPDVWRLGGTDLLFGRFRGFLMLLRDIADLEGARSRTV